MNLANVYIDILYGIINVVLVTGSLTMDPVIYNRMFFKLTVAIFAISGIYIHSFMMVVSAITTCLIGFYRISRYNERNKKLHLVVVSDFEDPILDHFIRMCKKDVLRRFPKFDFRIEPEYFVAMVFSEVEFVGLIVGEIENADTMRICLDYIIPKYSNTQVANTFYNCELKCIDFLGFTNFSIEPQSSKHNQYLERLGFKRLNGRYVNQN